MVSCVDKKYFEIVNWEYNGPRMVYDATIFFNATITPTPEPFNYCYSDPAHTMAQNIQYLLTFNGFRGVNWLSMSRDLNFHPFRPTFHIWNASRLPFSISLFTDHQIWVDKYYLGFLFICPSSYLLNNKYTA